MNAKSPIFILGNPRSGTTLLRLMLSCHRDIVIAPEGGFAVWLYSQYKHHSAQQFRNQSRLIAETIIQCKKMETWGLSTEQVAASILETKPHDWPTLVAGVYRLYCSSIDKPDARWGDKNNFYLNHVDEIVEMFPEVQFIHIVRDPRNVAASYRRIHQSKIDSPYAPKLPQNAVEIAHQWNTNVNKILDSLAGSETTTAKITAATNTAKHVRYEDLTTLPENCLREVCEFLNESFDANMVRFHESTGKLEPAETMPWKSKTLQPIEPADVDGYRDVITDSEADAIAETCQTLMTRFGYSATRKSS